MVMGINVRTAPGDCLRAVTGDRYTNAANAKSRFGRIWHDGQTEICGFTTITPPNGPSCSEDINVNADTAHSILAPTSNHTGGVNAVLCDGSVRFITNSVDTGTLATAGAWSGIPQGPSPFGVWGAMGSRGGGEAAPLND